MKKIYFSFLAIFASILTMAQVIIPLDFEGAGPHTWTDFSGGVTTTIDNPQKTGINTSNKVAKTIKMAGDPWGGSWIALTAPIDFSTQKTMRMKVYSPRVGAKVTLKVENGANGAINSGDIDAFTTVANTWEDLTFNLNSIIVPNTYDRVVVIFDNGTPGNGTPDFTFLFDDIRQQGSAPGALSLPTLPVTFESATVDYSFSDFDGGGATVVANTQKLGINMSDTTGRMVKSVGQPWGGSLLTLGEVINFSTNKTFRMKVYSPRANAKVLVKVEGAGASFEREVTMTKANEWEDLSFDYSAVSTSIQYNKIVLIFDLGTMGDGSANFTFLFDDIRLEAAAGGGLSQMNVPVTFDDVTVNYGLLGFGGAEVSTVEVDPTNAANKVAKVIKSNTAETWAGTTITAAGGGGFSAKLPFSVGNTFMNVRVWSPDAGIKVRLKVEDSGDPTKSVETEATTTVAGGWQNLVFNFTVPTNPPTAPINYAFNYNKASIFFNFGVNGATAGEKTYYFDEVVFGAAPLPVKLVSFEALQRKDAVALIWTTASEINNRGFDLERSVNGISWNQFQFVKAAQTNGQHTYNALDLSPNVGINYYRLKQVDLDGAFTYSPVRKINFDGLSNPLSVYPNPARNSLQIVAAVDAAAPFTITSSTGRSFITGRLSSGGSIQTIDIGRLVPGIYNLTITTEKGPVSRRFVVQ